MADNQCDPPFSRQMLDDATMAPWEEHMARLGICPKCSDSLEFRGTTPEAIYSQCIGCGCMFVVGRPAGGA